MTTLTFTARGDPAKQLQSDSRDLQRAANFAARSASRRLMRIGRQELQDKAGIRKASATRRVKAYGGKVWFGTVPVVATAPYVKVTRAKSGRRGLILDGAPVDSGFQRIEGRYRGVPFQNVDGRLVVIRQDIAEQAQEAFEDTFERADEVVGDEMQKAVAATLARST